MATNPQLNSIGADLTKFYDMFFVDNKFMVNELENINSPDASNRFKSIIKKILKMDFASSTSNGIFFDKKTGMISSDLYYFTDSFFIIFLITIIFMQLVERSDFLDKYNRLEKIELRTSENTQNYYLLDNNILKIFISNKLKLKTDQLKSPTIIENFDTYNPISTILNVSNPTTTNDLPVQLSDAISSPFDVLNTDNIFIEESINIDVFRNGGYQYDMTYNTPKQNLIKNYIKYIISFNSSRFTTQISAFFYYLILVLMYSTFIMMAEIYIYIDGSEKMDICEFFKAYTHNLMYLKVLLTEQISTTENSNTFTFNATCQEVCPFVIFKLEPYKFYKIKNMSIEKDYIAIIDGTEFDILNTETIKVENTTDYEYVSTITINLTGASCSKINYLMTDITKGKKIDLLVKSKSIKNFKKDFITIGKELNRYNSNIEQYKKKINTQYKKYMVQNDLKNSVKLKYNIFLSILFIIAISYLIISVITIDDRTNIIIGVGILGILCFLILFNYYYQSYYVESFVDATQYAMTANTAIDVSMCEKNTTIAQKVQFIQSNIQIFSEYTKDILSLLIIMLNNSDSLDMFKKISKSLLSEKNAFKEYEQIYSYKEKISKEATEVLKHDIIKRNAYLNMIIILFLIYTICYILYLIMPQYITLIFIIAIILVIINMSYFVMVLKYPVRVYSRNKYWSGPSNSTIISLGV